MIQVLKNFENNRLKEILNQSKDWQLRNLKSLSIDYAAPLVERIWINEGDYRFYLHVIHKSSSKDCLFHKHRWESAIHIVQGIYEMAITYNERDISSDEAHNIPHAAILELPEGSYYEMTNPHGLHYVNPLTDTTLSVMVSGNMYPEDIKEADHPRLNPLSQDRFLEIIELFKAKFL